MKLRFLTPFLLTSLVLLSSLATAQSVTKKVQFGLKAGANFSQLNDLTLEAPRLDAIGLPVVTGGQVVNDFFRQNDARTVGIVGGVFARFGNRVYIQPEVLVSVKGGKFDLIRQGLATQSISVRATTVDLPILLGVKLGPLRVNAGPMASLTVAQSGSLNETLQQYTTQPVSETIKQVQFGYQAGIGFTLNGLQLDLRREGSLSDLSAVGIQTLNGDARFTTKASLWQFTVGFGF